MWLASATLRSHCTYIDSSRGALNYDFPGKELETIASKFDILIPSAEIIPRFLIVALVLLYNSEI